MSTDRLSLRNSLTRTPVRVCLGVFAAISVSAQSGCRTTTPAPEQRDDANLLNPQMKAMLQAPTGSQGINSNPTRLASNNPNVTGSTGMSVRNSFDRHTIAKIDDTPTDPTRGLSGPPVNSLPASGSNVSAQTMPTTGGSLRPQLPIPQPPIQAVSHTQVNNPTANTTEPSAPAVKIVGTTNEEALRSNPPIVPVAPDASKIVPVTTTPTSGQPEVKIVPASPNDVATPPAAPTTVPATVAPVSPVAPATPVAPTAPTPPVLDTNPTSGLAPLTSPVDNVPPGLTERK